MTVADTERPLPLGLRENNALVGGMIGQERTVLPLLAKREFGLTALTATLTFIVAFGAVKAARWQQRRPAVRPPVLGRTALTRDRA